MIKKRVYFCDFYSVLVDLKSVLIFSYSTVVFLKVMMTSCLVYSTMVKNDKFCLIYTKLFVCRNQTGNKMKRN